MNHDDDRLPVRLPPPVRAAPGLVRITATAWLNAAQWSVLATLRTTRRLVAATRDPAAAVRLAQELGTTVGTVTDVGRAVARGVPLHDALATAVEVEAETDAADRQRPDDASLRERGAQLLERSRDVWAEDGRHPAFDRIVDDLAPDEARVLLLLRAGPQPSVDVRTGGPVGAVQSRLVAGGLTMIGPRAGCRHVDRVPAYLDNLHRLGLVWFSREPLRDPMEYQVLEAQPDVLEALHAHRFTKVVRRSIQLTPFGEDFCRTVLADDDADGDAR